MALSYNCLRLLVRPQRPVKYFLQKDRSSLNSCNVANRVFCSWRPIKESYRRGLRGFRTKRPTEAAELGAPEAGAKAPSLIKPSLFTIGVCGCSFVGAMIWNYEKMRIVFKGLNAGKEGLDKNQTQRRFDFRDHINSYWNRLSSGQKMIVGIIAANTGVFLLWRIPGFRSTMMRYFTTAATHPLPSMTLSSFSHINFLHLCVNMYVLWSFASVTVNLLGFEQFAAFYLSAGTVSSFASIACSKLLRRPFSVSVGASGAIMGLIGAVCLTYPNAQLSIAFVSEIFPHSFSADTGLKAIILFDVIGLALGWRLLDHAGHLGGMLFGLLYMKYGHKYIWGNREAIMKRWHNVRGKP